jgi:hypothetical protein
VLHRRDTEEEVDPNHRPLVDSRPFFIETKSERRLVEMRPDVTPPPSA